MTFLICFGLWLVGCGITLGYVCNGDSKLTFDNAIIAAMLWPLYILYKIGKFFAEW